MKLENPPTAIFAFKNYITFDAIDYLKKESPETLKNIDFVGFGNFDSSLIKRNLVITSEGILIPRL